MASVFNDSLKDARLAQCEALADADLYAAWQVVGKRLFEESPADFQQVFGMCLASFSGVPRSARELTINNWDALGAKMISANQQRRRIISAAIVQATELFEEVEVRSKN